MPKFIKFINSTGLTIINEDEIVLIDFDKDQKQIIIKTKTYADVKYYNDTIEEFKIMSDAIMEQLDI